nr:PREDICTED: zinc finger protein Xfin-like [Linepithema humile]
MQPSENRILDILRNYQSEAKHDNGVLVFRQPNKLAEYHCPRCNAGYTYKKTLMTHMKYDCGKEPRFKCPYCNKRDKCSSNIYKHIRVRHDGKPVYVDRLQSTRPATSFHAQPQEWHTATVTGFICPKCNAGFRRMWDLIRHKCGQTLRYACPYCHKKDNSSSNVCSECVIFHATENTFLRIPSLLVSSRVRQSAARKRRSVYSVNKSYYCPRCNHGFTLKKNMTRHLRHECGMAPKYQCPYCEKPSKFTQNIYAHIRKYHPGQALCFKRLY